MKQTNKTNVSRTTRCQGKALCGQRELDSLNSNQITLSWLKGFFEADGCFTASFSGKSLKPVAKFSQKSNSNLLECIQVFLENHSISSKIDTPKGTTDRAPALRIQGRNNVMKFLDLITADGVTPFLGITQRQLFVFQELLRNKDLTFEDKKQLLEFNRSDENNLTVLQTDSESVKKVKEIYKEHKKNLLAKITNTDTIGTLLEDDYIAGLLDGDGSYSVSFIWKKTKSNNYRIIWSESLTLTIDEGSYLTLLGFLNHIGSKTRICKSKVRRSISLKITKNETLSFLIDFHKKSPLLGTYSSARFGLLLEFRDLKKFDQLNQPEKIKSFLKKYYSICESSKGPSFKFSLEKCIAILDSSRFVE